MDYVPVFRLFYLGLAVYTVQKSLLDWSNFKLNDIEINITITFEIVL